MNYRKTTFNDLHIKVADRYSDLFKSLDLGYVPEKIDILISLGYSPLSESDLERLLNGSDEDLAHDVSGINSHIDRTTKIMDETFVPRCMRDFQTTHLRMGFFNKAPALSRTEGGAFIYYL